MTVDKITKEATSKMRGLGILVLLVAVIALALIFEPDGGFVGTWWSLVPPFVAIVLALITKEVYSSLFVGIVLGALFLSNFNLEMTVVNATAGFAQSVGDIDHAGILVFLVVLGVIGVLLFKSGGSKAYGEWALRHIKSRRGAQFATFLLGACIFVDDYFNCLTVGSVMRPLTDKFNISRAKLAYLIDSTAAPICIIAPVSSWAAAVASSLGNTTLPAGMNAMDVFIQCIPYNFYALFTIVMIICICFMDIDFGPMKKHEDNAKNGDLYTTPDRPYENVTDNTTYDCEGRVVDLVLPIVLLIISCVVSLLYTGGFFNGAGIRDAFANASASTGLAMGSIVALLMIIAYFIVRKAAAFPVLLDTLPQGFRNMVSAILILIFAWTLCAMTNSLDASSFVSNALDDAGSLKNMLPAIFMIIACFIAFATGTSWGTMGILIPIVVPVFVSNPDLLIIGIAASMAGAVFGDHCSPISDTTIMSSAGAECSHVNHVSTQAPYAILVASVCFVFYIIAGFWNSYIVTLLGIVAMVAILYVIKIINANKGGACA